MEINIRYDPRIKNYEKSCHMKDGKGHAVSIDPGTRIYREKGTEIQLRHWLREVIEAFDGELIPAEWAADYVGVSRPALHKRMKSGKLTVLVFEMQEYVKGILGGSRERMRKEYKFIPKEECDSWRDLLMEHRKP